MFNYKTRVSYSKVDKEGLLSISNAVDAMQDGCMFHNSAVGHSAINLLKKSRAWMVSSWHVIFDSRPKLDDIISVDAWIYQLRGTFSAWNYSINDENGNRLAYADAKWFYADPTTGKPAKIDDEERNAYELFPPIDMPQVSRKIECPDNLTFRYQLEVSPNYLDTNLHINNGQYIRLAVNALPFDYKVHELRAEYRKAARYGDTLYIYTTSIDGSYYVVFTDADKQPYFLSEFKSM